MKIYKELVFVLLAVFFVQCSSPRFIKRHCDAWAAICVVDRSVEIEYRDTTIIRLDTVKIDLPGDSVTIRDTVEIKDSQAYLEPIHKEFDNIGVDAWVEASILEVYAYYLDTTLVFPVADTIYLEKVIKETTIGETIREKYIPMIYRVALWLLAVLLIISIFIIFVTIRSGEH